jgi:hypothetical protein
MHSSSALAVEWSNALHGKTRKQIAGFDSQEIRAILDLVSAIHGRNCAKLSLSFVRDDDREAFSRQRELPITGPHEASMTY